MNPWAPDLGWAATADDRNAHEKPREQRTRGPVRSGRDPSLRQERSVAVAVTLSGGSRRLVFLLLHDQGVGREDHRRD